MELSKYIFNGNIVSVKIGSSVSSHLVVSLNAVIVKNKTIILNSCHIYLVLEIHSRSIPFVASIESRPKEPNIKVHCFLF